ncbi:Pyrimidine reductase, riboflavin biosynthesis [Blastococcus aurantiacus]|uniref:Pyrimidine reductase, riboflavin biosynthesis n=1 Tax=Blastococcus aurantiacus TaxID=1550231 RepID=A0A1G7HQL8_9ACTN|nr:dihydrofolate reductase family protein [Blastococcus aurantiacus]SDF02710.1 Pyrimidine reductase, riboflavin biosynthesis [Blastococcus aurantiacus]
MRRLLPSPAADLDDAALVDAYRLPPGRSLRMDFVASPDGSIAVDGRSAGLGSPGDKRVFRVLRALADVVLVGAGTAGTEGYRPVAPDSPVGRLRATIGRPVELPIAVVSRRASLDPASALASAPSTLVVTCAAADAGRRAALSAAGATVLVCGDDDVDLPSAVTALADRGLEQVTCEGGPQLLRAALTAGVVDELDLTIAPALVGAALRLLPDGLSAPIRLELHQLLEEDGVLFTRYRVAGSR